MKRSLLARAAAPVSSAAFPLGGASIIIAENPDHRLLAFLSALTFPGPENV